MYEYRAVVKYVHDGDTVTVDVDQGFNNWRHDMHIRMYAINAPELKTPEGPPARDFLMTLINPGDVLLLRSHKDQPDKYGGRWDGTLLTVAWGDDGSYSDEVNLNELMVSSGHAVRL
jgi:endonuclease YncB( thermonuclease family)